jgi:ATP-binding cassette subfamily F protein 3
LDIASKDVLVQALKSWEGTLLVVSHDRHFIEQFATKVWRTGNGRVEEYDGGFDYYLWKTQSESAASTDLAKEPSRTEKKKETPAPVAVVAPTENRKPSTDHAELKKLEKRISDLEKDKARMETELADPMVYSLPDYPHKVKAYKDVEAEIERVTDRWLMLQE